VRKRVRKYASGGAVPASPPEQTAPEAVAADVTRQPPLADDGTSALEIPPLAMSWLREHPAYLTDPRLNARLQALHWEVVDQGFEPYGEKYFEEINDRLGEGPKITPPTAVDRVLAEARAASIPDDDGDDDGRYLKSASGNLLAVGSRKVSVSAPPSREVPSTSGTRNRDNGRVTLTTAEKEAAKIAGVSQEEYALQKLRLLEAKARGDYGGQP
jgi:hypothetical protein